MSETDSRTDRLIEKFARDSDSTASNPGRLRVNPVRYVRAFPLRFWFWVGALGLGVLLGWLLHWLVLVPFGALAGWQLLRLRRDVRFQFLGGCINPGKVVSLDPPLVAVSTDLDSGGGGFPVVKVLRQPLALMSTGKPEVTLVGGKRLRIPESHFLTDARDGLAWFFDDVAEIVFERKARRDAEDVDDD